MFFVFVFCSPQIFCQGEIKKIKLYVIPIEMKFRKSISRHEIKKFADYKVICYNARNLLGFSELEEKINKDSLVKCGPLNDFRVLLIMCKSDIVDKRIYFRANGDFYYKGNYYYDNGLLKLVMSYFIVRKAKN